MAEPVTDLDSFKEFIRDRARETWGERGVPYYLSFVAIDLKKLGVNYHEYIGALRLSQWALSTELPDTKVVAHPRHKAKVGFVPAHVEFVFKDDDEPAKPTSPPSPARGRGRALIHFVESLANLPDGAIGEFHVPARTLIALLKS